MSDLRILWNYQQADLAVDRYLKEMRNNPNRIKLVKLHDSFAQQTEASQRIENEVAAMSERLTTLTAELSKLEAELRDLQDTLTEMEPENLDITRKSLNQAQKIVNAIAKCEQDLVRLRKDADVKDRQQHEVRVRAAKIKSEYTALKPDYDKEHAVETEKLNQMKAELKKMSEGIPKEMLDKYNVIKQHCPTPIALLVDGNRCGGCNMNLPQVLQREIKTGAQYVECENCGRIILVETVE